MNGGGNGVRAFFRCEWSLFSVYPSLAVNGLGSQLVLVLLL